MYGYRDSKGSRGRRIQNTKANKGTERVATLFGLAGMSGPLWHIDELLRVQCAESKNACFLRAWSPLIHQYLLPDSDTFNEQVWVRFWREISVLT